MKKNSSQLFSIRNKTKTVTLNPNGLRKNPDTNSTVTNKYFRLRLNITGHFVMFISNFSIHPITCNLGHKLCSGGSTCLPAIYLCLILDLKQNKGCVC